MEKGDAKIPPGDEQVKGTVNALKQQEVRPTRSLSNLDLKDDE